MKNSVPLLCLACLALLSTASAVRAQDDATPTPTTTSTSETAVEAKRSLPEAIVMSGGGLALIRNGTIRRVDQEIALAGGAKVSPGGTITTSDGTTTSLRDGQMISMDGKITAAPANVLTAASNVLAAGTSGPGVNSRDAAEARAYSTTTTSSPTPTGTTAAPPSGEIMGGSRISPDQPVGNPNPSASPSGAAVRRNGGTTR